MKGCHQKNIKVSAAKLQFKLKELKFMGTNLDQGMKPDPDKVAAITQMSPPENKVALLRFIGMVNYLSPFCANLSSVIQESLPFMRSKVQESAFSKAKQFISSVPVLAYYNLSASQLYFRRMAAIVHSAGRSYNPTTMESCNQQEYHKTALLTNRDGVPDNMQLFSEV